MHEDPLADVASAERFLRRLGVLPGDGGGRNTVVGVSEGSLAELRRLREATEEIVASVSVDEAPTVPRGALSVLNDFAALCTWKGSLSSDLTLTEEAVGDAPAGLLASVCVRELSACDATRLKTCERPECGLFFYDVTRNRSARWHAENPCGWRERAARR